MKPEELLREYIKKKFGTLRAFSEKIKMPLSTLSTILSRDLGKATLGKYFKICEGLGISPDRLYFGEIVEVKKESENKYKQFEKNYNLLSDYDKGLIDTVINYQLSDRRVNNEYLIAASGLDGNESEEEKEILQQIIEETSENDR